MMKNESKMFYVRRMLTGTVLFLGILGVLFQPEFSRAAAKKPTLSQKKLQMVVGKKTKLTVKNKKGYVISWRSNKKAIATVSKTGKIQAKKSGNARITAFIEPSKGGKSYRQTCQVSVRKGKRKDSASGNTENSSTPTIQSGANQSEKVGQKSNQPGTDRSGEAGQMHNLPGTEQSGEAGQMPNQPGIDPPESGPKEPEQSGPGQLLPENPADSATGGAVISGEAKLLFGDYNDNIPDGNFLGNQMIVSYEQLQNLMNQIQDLMNQIEEKMADEKVLVYYRFGYETLQRYFEQLETIEPDYFEDNVLYIHTMNVARGYEYTLDSAKLDIGDKTLHLYLERIDNVKEGYCVPADMPYYSYFLQIPHGLLQGCEEITISLIDQAIKIPSDDPDILYFINDVVEIRDQDFVSIR